MKITLKASTMNDIKGPARLYFIHYFRVVIVLFNIDFYKPAFSTYLFW